MIDNSNIKDQKLYGKKKLPLNDAEKSLLANNFIKGTSTKRFVPVQWILAVRGEGVQRNPLNFANEGLFWEMSTFMVNVSK